jgi:ketosteroid isomerase-like protein
MDAVQTDVAKIEKSIVKLFNQKKINEIMQFFSRDFVGFSSTRHERLTGLGQLKKTFLHYMDEGESVKYSIKGLKVNIYGEGALASFYWKVEISKKKKVQTIDGRASHFFLITDKGWKIVHEHYSKAH